MLFRGIYFTLSPRAGGGGDNNEILEQGKISEKVHTRAKRAAKYGLKYGKKRKNEEK